MPFGFNSVWDSITELETKIRAPFLRGLTMLCMVGDIERKGISFGVRSKVPHLTIMEFSDTQLLLLALIDN